MGRPKKILEVGSGIGAQKAIATAIDHPNVVVHAVEQKQGREHEIILRALKKQGLQNLKLTRGQSAVTYLRKLWKRKKRPVYDHVYAHWVLSVMNRQTRIALFKEIIKNIKPGSKWAIVDEGFIERQIADELRGVGFGVSVRRITLDQLIKNPPTSIEEVSTRDPMSLMRIGSGTLANYGLMKHFIGEIETLKRTFGEGHARELITRDKQLLKQRLESYETGRPTGANAKAIKRMVRGRGEDLQKPFVVITATKPRIRYVSEKGARSTSVSLKRSSEVK